MNLNKKQLIVSALAISVLASLVLAPSAKALSFNYSDSFLSYLTVSGSPDVTKPGSITTANVTGKLVAANQSAIFHITFYMDTVTQPSTVLVEADIALPINNGVGTVQYAVPIPLDALNNTYLYANISDNTRFFSKIPISLIQNPTYTELQSQASSLTAQLNSLQAQLSILQVNNADLQSQVTELHRQVNTLQLNSTNLQTIVDNFSAQITSLKSQVKELQSQNGTTSILMYIAAFVAAVFIATTGYFLSVILKKKT